MYITQILSKCVHESCINFILFLVGDVEDCLVEPINQGQFTPLPEALCWIILDMTASGQAAVMESICSTLEIAFPDIQKPSEQLVYDTLAKLMAEKKVSFNLS